LETAGANARQAEAAVEAAEAQIVQAQASLNQAEVNLDHTIITAPIDGIVISRNVDVGQTVAASMQAPTLFVIARDLTKMQVNASVAESDIGRIQPGQAVSFRVDAYPGAAFMGKGVAGTARSGHRTERRQLHHHHRRTESRLEAEARHDGQCDGRNRSSIAGIARPECCDTGSTDRRGVHSPWSGIP
jgi:multidrug resistance efflux pump